MGNFKFGEHSTKDFDLIIQAPPTYNIPAKDVTIEHVPGRNGDLLIDNKSWQNVERTYSVASVFRPGTDFIGNSERLIKWLTTQKGYHRLEDSYDPEVYRLAEYKNSGSLTNYYDVATAINISFDCKPQRYLKSGENPVKFIGSTATLENITGYPALPEITIKNVLPDDNEVLLVTSKNLANNEVNSIVTLKKIVTAIDPYDVTINSELQTVYSIQNGDINSSVSMNETDFPVLYNGKTLISINNYTENSGEIEQYNNLINRELYGNNVVYAKYRPFESNVVSKQKSINVLSYDLLKQKLQEVYEMKAYANYCLEKAEMYTFESFNTLLQNNCWSYTFQTDYSDHPAWLDFVVENDVLKIKVGDLEEVDGYEREYGYFITTNTKTNFDKRIIRGKEGTVIVENPDLTKTITIVFYPAHTTASFDASLAYKSGQEVKRYTSLYKCVKTYTEAGAWESVSSNFILLSAKPGDLDIDYSSMNMPNWLDFDIEYDDNNNEHSPNKIIYKHCETGFYYIPKSGLLSKACWRKYASGGAGELNSMTWNSWKKAFMPSGLSTSTTISYTYYFLSYPYKGNPGDEDYQEYLQYEPVYINVLNDDGSVKKDSNGNPIQKISNEVHFTVVPVGDANTDIASIILYAKDKGFFRFNDERQDSGWISNSGQPLDPGDQISGVGSTTSVNASNIIYFLKEVPDYSTAYIDAKTNENSWPSEWLDPIPVQYDNSDPTPQEINDSIINPTYIDFIVNKTGWYRYTYEKDGNTLNTDWVYRQTGEKLGRLDPNAGDILYPSDSEGYDKFRPVGLSTTIYFLESEDPVFPIKEYKYTDSNGNSIKNIGLFTVDAHGNEIELSNTPEDQTYEDLPSWLRIDIVVGEKEDYSDYILNFYPMQTGLYKWDQKSVWETKQAVDPEHIENKEIVSSNSTDDTSIYFMQSLPQYPTHETIYDQCRVEVNANVQTGNPESITIFAKIAGYYRAKNSSSWKYYNIGDEICNSKVSETTMIYYLTDSQNSLDNIEIIVIPRWWSL